MQERKQEQKFNFSSITTPELKDSLEPRLKEGHNNICSLNLDFNCDSYIDQLLNFLNSNPQITNVYISKDTPFGGVRELAEIIEHNITLKEIGIDRIDIVNKEVKVLAKALEKNTTIHTLRLTENRISDETVISLLNKSLNLQTLNLFSNDITVKGIITLLNTNKLKALQASLCPYIFPNEVISHQSQLKQAFSKNKTLTALNLSKNDLGDNAIIELVKALNPNSTLRNLDLSSTYITSKAAAVLAANNYLNLEKLSLACNPLKEAGGIALAAALATNTSLEELDLSNASLGEKGIIPLAKALKKNNSLRVLNLFNNFITDKAAEELKESIEKNYALHTLEMRNIQSGEREDKKDRGSLLMILEKINQTLANNQKTHKNDEIRALSHLPDPLINCILQYELKRKDITSIEVKTILSEAQSVSLFGRSLPTTPTSSQESALPLPSPKKNPIAKSTLQRERNS